MMATKAMAVILMLAWCDVSHGLRLADHDDVIALHEAKKKAASTASSPRERLRKQIEAVDAEKDAQTPEMAFFQGVTDAEKEGIKPRDAQTLATFFAEARKSGVFDPKKMIERFADDVGLPAKARASLAETLNFLEADVDNAEEAT